MSAKMASKPHQFKKPGEYSQAVDNPVDNSVKEVFFRLKLMPAGLVQYAVEKVTVVDGNVVERKVVTERDILWITMSKLEQFHLQEIRR